MRKGFRNWTPRGRTRRNSPRRAPVQHETVEQTHGIRLLQALGGRVFVSGTKRSRGQYCPSCHAFVPNTDHGTHQTPGIPDVEAFLPRRNGQPGTPWVLLKWEAKRPAVRDLVTRAIVTPAGRLTAEQKEYKTLCDLAEVYHVGGDIDALIAWLIEHEFVRSDSVPHYRLPQPAEAQREGR